MARYGVERYWLQAVSDYDLTSRVKMIVAACLLVKHLGGDPVQTAQLYSKEIENNAVAVRARKAGDMGTMSVADFCAMAHKEVEDKVIN